MIEKNLHLKDLNKNHLFDLKKSRNIVNILRKILLTKHYFKTILPKWKLFLKSEKLSYADFPTIGVHFTEESKLFPHIMKAG